MIKNNTYVYKFLTRIVRGNSVQKDPALMDYEPPRTLQTKTDGIFCRIQLLQKGGI